MRVRLRVRVRVSALIDDLRVGLLLYPVGSRHLLPRLDGTRRVEDERSVLIHKLIRVYGIALRVIEKVCEGEGRSATGREGLRREGKVCDGLRKSGKTAGGARLLLSSPPGGVFTPPPYSHRRRVRTRLKMRAHGVHMACTRRAHAFGVNTRFRCEHTPSV